MAMESDSHSSNKIDNLVGYVEKLLDKLTAVETHMSAKCGIETVVRLDARVKSLEDRCQPNSKSKNSLANWFRRNRKFWTC